MKTLLSMERSAENRARPSPPTDTRRQSLVIAQSAITEVSSRERCKKFFYLFSIKTMAAMVAV